MKVALDDETALVLFDFLSRTLDEQYGSKLQDAIVHEGELWALNSRHCILEQTLSEPFSAKYRVFVENALEGLVAKSGEWPKDV